MGRGFARACAVLFGGVALLAATVSPAAAAGSDLRKAGNIVVIALPAAAVGISLAHDGDWKGLGEFAISTGLTVGSAYLIRELVRENRPDHSDMHTLTPPDLALADASANYLWSRYGWKYGVPAYALRFVVSEGLTDAKKNHWYDTLATSALAFTFNYAFVTNWKDEQRYRFSVNPQPGGASLRFTMNF